MKKKDSNKTSPVRITERDRELLKKLAEYRLLSTEQIRYLLYPSMNRARKRVLQLFRHGIVARYSRPIRLGEGSSQYLYRPSRNGMALLTGTSATNVRPPRAVTESQGEHTLRINDFRISLELASRQCDDIALTFWKPDHDVKLVVPVTIGHRLIRVPVIPDGFFGLRLQGKELFYMIEVDRGTAPLTRSRTKLEAYLNLWQSKSLLAELNIPTFRLLWITSGQQRLQNLLKVVQGLTAKYTRTDIVFLTTQDQVKLEQPETILGRVWQIVTKSEVLPASPFPTIPFERSRSHQVNHQCANQKPELAKGEHGPGG